MHHHPYYLLIYLFIHLFIFTHAINLLPCSWLKGSSINSPLQMVTHPSRTRDKPSWHQALICSYQPSVYPCSSLLSLSLTTGHVELLNALRLIGSNVLMCCGTPIAVSNILSLMKKVLFDEKWHQLRLLVTEDDVTLYVDDLEVETLPLEPPVGIFINGKTQVGKYVSKETTVPVRLMTMATDLQQCIYVYIYV